MREKVVLLDTSILCVWLKVTDHEDCGPDGDKWDYERVNARIEEEIQNHSTFVLPLATIIETGNHIAHSRGDRFPMASALREIVIKSADEESPWAAFSEQELLWKGDGLKSLLDRWQKTAITGQSMGDASIVDVANLYYKMGMDVEILTGDNGLKAYQPTTQQTKRLVPRRRK